MLEFSKGIYIVSEVMYKCLINNWFEDPEGYGITSIRQEDMELIRLWRNAQIDILRQKTVLSLEEQRLYFQKVIYPTFSQEEPKQIIFSFLFYKQCIGYGGLTNIDWGARHAEVSFLVDPLRVEDGLQYKQDFTHFLTLLCQIAFQILSLHRLFTETFAFRTYHMQILEEFGFKQEGILREHVFKRHHWHDSVMHGLLSREWSHEK